jgi:hypothetical protein
MRSDLNASGADDVLASRAVMASRAIIMVVAVVAAVVIMMVALIVWAAHEAHAPHPDRSGSVVKKYIEPEETHLTPVFIGKTMVLEPQTTGPDWILVVRRPDGSRRTVWVRKRVYEQCRIGDWFDSPRRICRP